MAHFIHACQDLFYDKYILVQILDGNGGTGDEEQAAAIGILQLRATSDGSKAYVIWHSTISAEEDPNVEYTRYYPWKPEESTENDIWFRRLIFWPEAVDEVIPE